MDLNNLIIDNRIYSIEAIRAACMDIIELAHAKISQDNSGIVISFSHLKASIKHIKPKFERLLLAHQTRLDIETRTKTIRELIVAQAFAPCENIEDIVKRIPNEE